MDREDKRKRAKIAAAYELLGRIAQGKTKAGAARAAIRRAARSTLNRWCEDPLLVRQRVNGAIYEAAHEGKVGLLLRGLPGSAYGEGNGVVEAVPVEIVALVNALSEQFGPLALTLCDPRGPEHGSGEPTLH